MHEEDEVWLPEFELLHASNGEEALSIIQAGKESNCPIAVAYIDIRKPFAHEEIQQITLSLVEKWNIERELAEKRRQLTNGHRRLEAVLNATGDAIAMHDSDGHGEMIGSLVLYRDVSKEIEAEQMRAEVLRLRTELETTGSFADLVGTGPGMRQVYALMKQAAEGDIAVLIRGESGTGKELVAKSVHHTSPRKQGSFVALNCAAIPDSR